MVLQTNSQNTIKVLDSGRELPFSIKFSIGSGVHAEWVYVTQLVELPQNLNSCIYDVTEFKDLKLYFNADNPKMEINLIWNDLKEVDEDPTLPRYSLSMSKNELVLFENMGDGEAYPWRCGLYHFEIHFGGKIYYGGINIKPKNVSTNQMTQIHKVINRELQGLVLDYLHYKKTFGILADVQESSQWRFLNWYRTIEAKLLNAIRDIEKRSLSKLEKSYKTEDYPRHLDNRSVRWQHSYKGIIYQNSKFYNRYYYTDWDIDENRMVKYVITQLLHDLDQSLVFIRQMEEEYVSSIREVLDDIQILRDQHEKMMSSKKITSKDKKRIDDTISVKELKNRQLTHERDHLKKYRGEFETYRLNLSAILSTVFWNNIVNRRPKAFKLGSTTPSYRIIYEIWKEASQRERHSGADRMEIPTYKPTSLLYEYYVLFGAIRVFRELGFKPDSDSISDQLMKTFFQDGLRDGTKVSLVKDDLKVVITYDEMIEPNGNMALERGTHFFGNSRRKPDIRMDLYKMDNQYISSFIIEVKYSPFFNIHSDAGNTKAMEQMNEYWRISYIYKNDNGERKYNRSAIHNVVCVYPGDSHQPLVYNDDCGIFLQYFPNENSVDPYDIIGFNQLCELIRDWIVF